MADDPNFAVYRITPTQIPALAGRVDGYPSEEHRLGLYTTEHPIESGSTLTDNAVRQRELLRLEGWVSDLLPGDDVDNPDSESRAQDVWSELAELFRRRQPVRIITAIRVYDNMLLVHATAPRNRQTGRSLRFTLEFEEVLFSDTDLTRLKPDDVDAAGPAADRTSEVDGGERQSPEIDLDAAVAAIPNIDDRPL